MLKVTDTFYSKMPVQKALADDSTLFTAGNLIYADTSTGTVKEATGAAGTTLNIVGIVKKTQTTGTGTYIEYFPTDKAVFVTADCTNNTAADQLNKNHVMTDAGHVANTNTSIATTLAVFHAMGLIGASSAKQLYGYFIKIGQVTA